MIAKTEQITKRYSSIKFASVKINPDITFNYLSILGAISLSVMIDNGYTETNTLVKEVYFDGHSATNNFSFLSDLEEVMFVGDCFDNEYFKEMLALIQLLKNHDCTYKLKASECDYMVTKIVLNGDGSERTCSKLKYVNQAIENGKQINIITFEELLNILKVTEDELSQMPFPDESSFLKKEKEQKLKKDKTRYSSGEDSPTTIGDILKAKGITI